MVVVDLRTTDLAPAEFEARAQLRAQITALESQLSDAQIASFPDADAAAVTARAARAASAGPRVLGLGDLEAVRDALVERLAGVRAQAAERGERQEASRALLERMLLEPGRHKFVRVANRELGEGGCGVWQVRPRLGLIGMLMGWWQVKLSSGCPLAG
jgi:hypothetical protein